MKKVTHLSTDAVDRLLFAIPATHKHYRLALITRENECLILSEAVVAAVVRAYVGIKTHPLLTGIEMTSVTLPSPKEDFANHQLLETEKSSAAIQAELLELLGRAER
jgi:hypothetical protein